MVLFSRHGKRRPSKHKGYILIVVTLLFVLLFLFATFMFIKELSQSHKEQAVFEELSSIVSHAETQYSEAPVAVNAPDAALTEEAAILPQYEQLHNRNEDFIGWLKTENAVIDLPVMFTPDDPEYYLRRDFDKNNSQSGTPFIGEGGNVDSDCLIIYGHNMKNRTMFGPLDYYAEKDFWESNRIFSFDTLYEHREYEVFAAVKTHVLYVDEVGFRYYNYSGELTEEEYKELTEWLISQTNYDTGIVPVYGEQLLILSTCSYHTDNGRFIVAARQIS